MKNGMVVTRLGSQQSTAALLPSLPYSTSFTSLDFGRRRYGVGVREGTTAGLARNNRRLLFYRRCPTVPLLPLVLLAIFGYVDFPHSYGIKRLFFEQRILPFFQGNITIFSREYYHFFKGILPFFLFQNKIIQFTNIKR